jgi:hypothetical protein
MPPDPQTPRPGRCFLCDPEPEWTWCTSERFFAVLGLGPIRSGYTVVATREHFPSMLDLDHDGAVELEEFTALVRSRLGEIWGSATVAEHGRVAPCLAPATRRHEAHCLHAHRLVFAGHTGLDLRRAAPSMSVRNHPGYLAAHRSFTWPGQYVYVEDPAGHCQIGEVRGPLPRQFLRAIVAAECGRSEMADWRSHPQRERVDAARRLLAVREPVLA